MADKVVLNSKGLRELIRSDEIRGKVREEAQNMAERCGGASRGYFHDEYDAHGRYVCSVYTGTLNARNDNLANNTLLKGMGSS